MAFQLWRSSPLEKGPHWPIMALPWIHHCADLAQKSKQMCGSHEYSQMLVDNCYAFSLLLQHSTLKVGPLFKAFPLKCMHFLWISRPYFFLKIKLLRTSYISFCRVTFPLINYCKKAVPCVSYKETKDCRSLIPLFTLNFFSESTTKYLGQKQFGTW